MGDKFNIDNLLRQYKYDEQKAADEFETLYGFKL